MEENIKDEVTEQDLIVKQIQDDESERCKQYNEDNVMSVERLDFETQAMYKRRRAYMNKRMKSRLRGSFFFVSKVTVPMKAEEDKDKTEKMETFTNTFRYKDHPELQRKIFKEQVIDEEAGNKDD